MNVYEDHHFQPIFVVGAPRSGTTLLNTMLNRHSRIGLCHETFFFYFVANRQRTFGDLSNLERRRYLVKQLLQTRRIRQLDLDLDALRETLEAEGASYSALFASLMRFYARANGKRRYGEKTPQHALVADTLCRVFPSCRMIHLIRDPRDVTSSLLRMPWAANDAVSNARLWRDCVTTAERCRGKEQYLLVRFEELVTDPEMELRRICSHIGEQFEPRMLAAETPKKMERWWFNRAQKAITKERLETWRKDLDPGQVSLVEWVTAPLMPELGYEPQAPPPSRLARAAAVLRAAMNAVSHRARRFPALWYRWMQPDRLAAEEAAIERIEFNDSNRSAS